MNAFNDTCLLISRYFAKNVPWRNNEFGTLRKTVNKTRLQKQREERDIAPYGSVTTKPSGELGRFLEQ